MLHITKLITHSGIFHADDVFSTALFRIMGYHVPVFRVSEVPEDWMKDPSIIVYDIGFGPFDHHQADSEVRENGIPYAAFGLLTRHFREVLFSSDGEYERFDREFVQYMDGSDNGFFEGENQLSRMIEAFNPAWDEPMGADDAFPHAVSVATILLGQKLKQNAAMYRADLLARQCTPVGHVLYLDRYIPANRAFQENDDVKWVCFPSQRGGWMVSALQDRFGHDKSLFPPEYRGKEGDQLPEGMLFCHKNGFCAVFDSKERARQFVESL